MTEDIPRTLFGYWHQGRDAAPEPIRRCWDLWARMNPDWTVRILDWSDVEADFRDFGVNAGGMSFTGVSNIVRLHNLAERGGVWVDAYTVPLRPLGTYLPALTGSGFFAFHDPYRKRMAETWFLAARPGHPLVAGWRDKMVEYWRIPRRPMRFRRELDPGSKGAILRALGRMLDMAQGGGPSIRGPKRIWQPRDPNWAVDVTRGGAGRPTPYFACAMLFDLMLDERPDLFEHWRAYPKTTSYDTLFLRHWKKRYGDLTPLDIRRMADGTPMQKLSLPVPLPEPLMDELVAMAEAAMPGTPARGEAAE